MAGTERTVDERFTPEWRAYQAWLIAARSRARGDADTDGALAWEVRRSGLTDPLTQQKVGNWIRRCSLPDEPVRSALVAAVQRLVPDPPDNDHVGHWHDFQGLVEHLAGWTGPRTVGGGGHSGTDASEGERQPVGSFPALRWAGTIKDMDPLRLGLGSWVFDGGLPGYVPRTPDPVVAEAMTRLVPGTDTTGAAFPSQGQAGSMAGVVVIAGPPKSGKSRSVVEVLKATLPADMVVWWVNSAPGSLSQVLARAQRLVGGDGGNRDEAIAEHGLVVVIDDAHLCGVNPTTGLTEQHLNKLTRYALVVATVHEAELAAWAHAVIDRAQPGYDTQVGATPGLVDLMGRHRIDYPVELTAQEYPNAIAALPARGSDEPPREVTRWAEYLAAVDQLRARADEGRAQGGYRKAVIDAAVDAAHLYLPAATTTELEDLAQFHYRRIAPTRAWDNGKYDTVLDWATTPIGGEGSPHAIVVYDHDNTGYRLLDSLTASLVPTHGWTPQHLTDNKTLTPTAALNAGLVHSDREEPDLAHPWFQRAAEAGNTSAMFNLGLLHHRAGKLKDAETWWQRAAHAGNTDAMYNLGHLHHKVGRLEGAETWWQRAAEAGHVTAMNNLGSLLDRAGREKDAKTWWQRAAEAGDTTAMFKLGSLLDRAGRVKDAETWWQRAAEAGNTDAMFNLGHLHHKVGRLEGAETWWQRAAEAGHVTAMNNLGSLLDTAGRVEDAEAWWQRAAEAGNTDAMFNLGLVLDKAGHLKDAETWYQCAAEAGDTKAMNNLGLLHHKAGRAQDAETWYQRAAEAGDTEAMVNLGALHDKAGRVEDAQAWYQRAADAGDPDAGQWLEDHGSDT